MPKDTLSKIQKPQQGGEGGGGVHRHAPCISGLRGTRKILPLERVHLSSLHVVLALQLPVLTNDELLGVHPHHRQLQARQTLTKYNAVYRIDNIPSQFCLFLCFSPDFVLLFQNIFNFLKFTSTLW